MAVSADIKPIEPVELTTAALTTSVKMPDLIVAANKIANSIINGWHGLRKRGAGDNFWQFRPYAEGESVARIDWRRSARDDHMYIRDREWEAAQTVWLVPDLSDSMHYRSKYSNIAKDCQAILLTLTLVNLFVRWGERIAIPDAVDPICSRHACEHVALSLQKLIHKNSATELHNISRFSHVIIMSDFLDDPNTIIEKFGILSDKNVHAHFIEICDPAEERFPYSGRTEFIDPETGTKLLAGKAESYADTYHKLYHARRATLADFARKHGWSYQICSTDRPLTDVILGLANMMRSTADYRRF